MRTKFPATVLSALTACVVVLSAQVIAPITQWIQAENFSALSGVTFQTPTALYPRISVDSLGSGDWVRFDSVNFLDGQFDSVTLYYWWDWTTYDKNDAVRLRLDSPGATPIASFANFTGGSSRGYTPADTASAALSAVTGIHSLYVTVEGAARWLQLDKLKLRGRMAVTASDAKTYYVATNGSDGNDGLSLEKPFRTIQKAASVMKPGSTCRIRAGIYRETVRPSYSGVAGSPLTFEAYNGENAVVSGADPITGWTVHSGSIYKAPMRWTLGLCHDQVLIDGKMAWVARTPNVTAVYDPHEYMRYCGPGVFNMAKLQDTVEPISVPAQICWSDNGTLWPAMNPATGTAFDMSVTDQWPSTNPIPPGLLNTPADFFKGGIITIHNAWLSTGIITGSRSESTTKTVINAIKTSSMWVDYNGPGWISHLFGLLDSPNEWFRQDSALYLWAPDNGDPSHHLVEAKRRLLAFDLRGKQFISLKGVRVIAASVSLEDASSCLIDGCHFRYISHADTIAWYDIGVGFYSGPWNAADGHSGIYISGHDNLMQNCSVAKSSAAGVVVAGKNNRVTNCIVKECNYGATGQGGITLWRRDMADPADGRNIRIDHNTCAFNMRANIQIGAAWSPSRPDDPERPRVQYNDFGPSVYMCSEQGSLSAQSSQYVEADHNWFHGTAGNTVGDIVMEFDMGARHWTVHHNVFWQGSDVPTYADGYFQRGFSWTFDWSDTGVDGARCFNNTVVDSSARLHRDWETWITPQGQAWPCTRDPLYTNNLVMGRNDTAQWKFTDPTKRDYTLRAASPAIDKGKEIAGWVGPGDYTGSAPDLGAYEFGKPRWTAGADWHEQPWVYPPADLSGVRIASIIGDRGFRPMLTMLPRGMRIDAPKGVAYCIQVFDMKGAVAFTREISKGGSAFIPVSSYAPGVYVTRVTSVSGCATWKLMWRK